jgi:hypothetical protein
VPEARFRISDPHPFRWVPLYVLMCAIGVVLLITTRSTDFVLRGLGLWLLFLGASFLFLTALTLRSKSYLTLTREGIHTTSPGSKTLVTWDSILETGSYTKWKGRYLGLKLSTPPRVTASWVRLLVRMNRPLSGWDVVYPVFLMADSDTFMSLVERYRQDAAAREELA